MPRSHRFLILGGTQFIGPHVARWLLEMGHHVAVFHRGSAIPDELAGNVAQIHGDRRRLADSVTPLRQFKPDVVIDMLAMTRSDAEALEQVFGGHAGRVVVAGSADVYAAFAQINGWEPPSPYTGQLTERSPLRTARYPFRFMAKDPGEMRYHYDKLDVEEVVMGSDVLPATVVRLPCVYGPRDPQTRCTPYLKELPPYGEGVCLGRLGSRHRLCRGYVANMAWAIALAATHDDAEGRVFHVSDEPTLSELDWVRAITKVCWHGDGPAPAVTTEADDETVTPDNPRRFPSESHLDFDCAHIRKTLGYQPRVEFWEGLRRTVAWEGGKLAHPAAQGVGGQ